MAPAAAAGAASALGAGSAMGALIAGAALEIRRVAAMAAKSWVFMVLRMPFVNARVTTVYGRIGRMVTSR